MDFVLFLLTKVSIVFISCNNVNYNGYYTEETQEISICMKKDKEIMKETIIHELGHYFFKEYLTKDEQNIWIELYNHSYPDDFVSLYAMSSYKEDFAETFLYVFSNKKIMTTGLMNLKIDYIKYLIKSNYGKY